MSWLPSLQRSSVAEIISLIMEPLMRSVHRLIPIVAGFDVSHLFLLVLLQLISIIVFNPNILLIEIGTRWAL
ncbi:YggT family protein [Coxiella-like endosymbiont]|uniref:YggT family protein n=1 Tax=Coxiella-like endosymbiont TaxID=1592897 RepID=UPI0027296D9B|nr:YggT family protein [Coxiella-like endosymbiont]